MTSAVKVGLPPIADSDTRLFILGSLPGDASLAASRYYAHSSNQFWRLLGGALGEPLQDCDYPDRLLRLKQRGVGLWDVVAGAERRGSLDQAIRKAENNRLAALLTGYPKLRAIAFNGTTAATKGRRLLAASPSITLIDLPSSSAANTRPIKEKAEIWAQLAHYALQIEADLRNKGV